MKFLIPPSEGKAKVKPSNVLFSETDFALEEHVQQVVDLLDLIDDEDLQSVYGTSQEKSELLHRQNQDIFKSRCAPAINRYTGVVYQHIEWETLDEDARKFLNENFLIFSGLFGVLSPQTPIPNYKLKMNVLSLQYHWNPIITEELKDEDLIIDMLPQVHRKAYTPGKNVKQIDFIVKSDGKNKAAGHFGKAVKGKLIRYIAQNKVTDLEGFYGFEYQGFKWDGKAFVKNG